MVTCTNCKHSGAEILYNEMKKWKQPYPSNFDIQPGDCNHGRGFFRGFGAGVRLQYTSSLGHL